MTSRLPETARSARPALQEPAFRAGWKSAAALGLGLAVLCAAPPAHAERDWFASLYTSEGIELRADERVFTLYALLNAMGYDESPVVRQFPIPARDMHPVRLRVRNTLRLDPAQEAKASSYFDAHPLPVENYMRYALTVGGSAGFARTPESPAELKDAEALLSSAYSSMKIGELFASVQSDYRTALKTYLPVLDAPVMAVRKLLKVKDDEPANVVLVVNLLDARGKAFSSRVGGELFVVLGPSRDPELFAVAREVARARLQPVVQAKAAAVKGLAEATQAAREAGAEEQTSVAWATEILARSFAARALKLPESGVETQARGGYRPVSEMARLVDDFHKSNKTLDVFTGEALAAIARSSGAKK